MYRICNSFLVLGESFRTSIFVRTLATNKPGDKIVPVKMAFTSYESTDPSESSNKPPLLIMHGLFGSKNNWNSIAKAIHAKTKTKVITLDARNHGDSPHTDEFSYEHMSEDIDHFLKTLNIKESTLLGHSMGGRSVMYYALTHTDDIEKIIVVDISPVHTSSSIYDLQSYFHAMRKVKVDKNLPMSEGRAQADQQLRVSIRSENVRQFLLTNFLKTNEGFKWRLNVKALANSFQLGIAYFPEFRGMFDKPALFIGGTRSDYLDPRQHDAILMKFPQATFAYLEAGHWVHADRPNEFIQIVSDFVSK